MAERQSAILLVDDEFTVRDSLERWFRKDGYRVTSAESGMDALRCMEKDPYDVALLDIRMPGMDGLELQRRLKSIDPHLEIIIITAFASVDTAVEALKQGAFDYVTKPVDPDELSHLVRNALEQRKLRTENVQLRQKIEELGKNVDVIGESPQMKKVLEMVRNVAHTDATVLIRGESGTGKEVIARAIHHQSHRRLFPLVPVNCGALTETLLESELFGHEKGAFTGAQYRRKGKFEMADGGTLFLDEVGTVGSKTQVDLLRVLESKEFARVGGNKPIQVDFRVICATNQNLEKLVEEEKFREDLYYRINVFTIFVPPLRERRPDIPLLASHFMKKFSEEMDKHMTEIESEALDQMVRYNWPGNVRELANAIERAMVVGKSPILRAADLPFQVEPSAEEPEGDSLADMEKIHIERILERTGWNITQAAETLRIDRVTLYNKIKKYGLRK